MNPNMNGNNQNNVNGQGNPNNQNRASYGVSTPVNSPKMPIDQEQQLEKTTRDNEQMAHSHRGFASDVGNTNLTSKMPNQSTVINETNNPINQVTSSNTNTNVKKQNIGNNSNNISNGNSSSQVNVGKSANSKAMPIGLNRTINSMQSRLPINQSIMKNGNNVGSNREGAQKSAPQSLNPLSSKKNMLDMIKNPKKALFNGLKGGLPKMGLPKPSDPIKRDEQEATKGNVTIKIPFKVKIAIAAIVGGLSFIFIFFMIILSDHSTRNLMGIDLSDIAGSTSSNIGSASISSNIDDYFSKQYEDLGNIFTDKLKCEDEECSNRNEILFYKKIGDIALRYRNKYHVELDWPLIAATSFINDTSHDEIMRINLNNYNSSDVANTNVLMNLDWDYDYTNIQGYTYLSSYSFAYDLQILAKNMVRKTTVQTCTDRNGNVIASRTDQDIEDQYLQAGGSYHLACNGNYSINSSYVLDKDKYDEFLLEFIEHKYYLQTGDPSEAQNNIYSDTEVPGNSTVIPNVGDITISNTGYALGMVMPMNNAVITSTFFNYSYAPHHGSHGAVDLSNHNDTRIMAAWDGVVVATGLVMNGYGNQVVLQHSYNGQTFFTHYSHMQPGSVTVKVGDSVKAGQQIGTEGGTGSSATSGNNQYGHHLDFQIAVCDSFNNADFLSHLVNPLSFMNNQISSLDELTIWRFEINSSHEVVKKGKDYDFTINKG